MITIWGFWCNLHHDDGAERWSRLKGETLNYFRFGKWTRFDVWATFHCHQHAKDGRIFVTTFHDGAKNTLLISNSWLIAIDSVCYRFQFSIERRKRFQIGVAQFLPRNRNEILMSAWLIPVACTPQTSSSEAATRQSEGNSNVTCLLKRK